MSPVLPQHIVERMSPEDRGTYAKSLGAPALGLTKNEARDAARSRCEKELQRDVGRYLNMLEIEYICPPMHRRSVLPEGWPDFTLCYKGFPVALECKAWGEKPRPEQSRRMEAMRANGWLCHVVYSVADVQDQLRQLDARAERRDSAKDALQALISAIEEQAVGRVGRGLLHSRYAAAARILADWNAQT